MQVEICRHLIVCGKFYRLHVSNLHLCAKRTGNSWYKYWALRWKDVFHASQSGVQIPWKYKTQHHHLDVYQRSLSAIHLHAAVHNCGRGQSNWGLRSCLKYFVFCRSLRLWLFFLPGRSLFGCSMMLLLCSFLWRRKKQFMLCCHPEFCISHLMLAAVGLSGLPEL